MVMGTGMHVAWVDNSDDEEEFVVERKDGPAGAFAVVATVPFDTDNLHDAPLISGTSYTYRVAASNEAGLSAYTDEVMLAMP